MLTPTQLKTITDHYLIALLWVMPAGAGFSYVIKYA